MASRIDHGAPGSFKSFALVQRFGIPALQEGRTVVTNIRGFNSIDRVKQQFPKIDFPESAKIIHVTSETKVGRLLMAGFFHWIPFRALILMDEAQRIYPKRASFKLESLNSFICPVGYTPDRLPATDEFPSGLPRPEDVYNAFDMQRHFQWDIYLSTPHINKIQPLIREVCVTAFLHKSLGEKLPFLFKNTWYEFQHDAENTGKSLFNRIGSPSKYKADSRIFKCYQSTATGEHTASKADKSILSDTGVRIKLVVILLAVCTGGYFMSRLSQIHSDTKNGKPETNISNQTTPVDVLPVPLASNTVLVSSSGSNVDPDDGLIENPDLSNQLGFNILALAVHDLKDTSFRKLAFVVESKKGLKIVSFKNIESYGFEVFIHGLCHVTLKDKKGHLIDLTCQHNHIDTCGAVMHNKLFYSQHECLTYDEPVKPLQTENAIVTASTNLLSH